MASPIIGLTTYDPIASWGAWKGPATLVPQAYVDAVVAAGGMPVALPAVEDPDAVLDRVDALILIGGPDVDPSRYGAAPHESTRPASELRDGFEFALLDGAERRSMPVLAICRGVQVLNVLRKGTLHQHLPDVVGSWRHAPAPGRFGSVEIEIRDETRLAEILGSGRLLVECSHHQAIDVLGEGLVVSARSDDGVVEGVEDPARHFMVGVQSHPEAGTDRRLLHALVEAC
jgi:gamma-glutamyl-gamma-aminobutyrate hydrolase PuuD